MEEEYEYYILNVTLTNHGIDYVARNKLSLSAEQLQRYEILLETFGNKKYLFENDPYAAPQPGDYQDHTVPSEYLTDVEFGNMLHEAEKYLGYSYVWGGSSQSTSLDCSGFVSYVINHCGNGWNVGSVHTIIDDCDTLIYMGGNNPETAHSIAIRYNKTTQTILHMPLCTSWVFRRGEKPFMCKNLELDDYLQEKVIKKSSKRQISSDKKGNSKQRVANDIGGRDEQIAS